MQHLKALVAAALTLIAAFVVTYVSAQAQRTDEVTWGPPQVPVTLEGSYSGVRDREYHRIVDAQSWRALWERHAGAHAERDSYGEVVVPAIDFDKFMVVAVFNGEGWNTRDMHLVETLDAGELHLRFDAGTYQTADFEPTEIVIEGEVTPEEIEKRVLENMEARQAERQANRHNDPNFTAAYGIWILPRTLNPIVLIENVQGLLGAPPIWEEKHRVERVKK
jgi:hypothetical protein